MTVGRNDIAAAIIEQGCGTIDAVGVATGAGTGTGSCRSEIGRLIETTKLAKTG